MAYLYYAAIVIDHNQIAATQTDFPVLVSGIYDGTGGEPDIRTVANGGHVENTASGGASGSVTVPADLVFSPNTDGSSPYDFEIERYVPTTGEIVAWVEIPTLSDAINTTFYMVYGDATVVISQEDVAGTWNSSFKAVYHLGEASGTIYDSTGNGIDLTAQNGPTYAQAGQVGLCMLFDDALSQYLEATVAAETTQPITMSCLIKPDTDTVRLAAMCLRDNSDSDQFTLFLYGDVVGDRIRAYASGALAATTASTTTGFNPDIWYHIHGVFENNTSRAVYLNAGGKGTNATDTGAVTGLDRTWIGRSIANYFSGYIDEARIADQVRDDDYVTTERNSMLPASFYSMGAEAGGPPIPIGILPEYELSLMRSHPQMTDAFLVVQQPQRFTEAPYLAQQEWVDYDWYCRVNGDMTAEIAGEITVNNGGPAEDLIDGMTILIGSEKYGDWDRGVVRLRTDQTVGPGTTTLYIATSSDLRGRVFDGDYIVVLDEHRLWQRFGQIDADAAGNIIWYKDHEITWEDLGPDDATRRLAMMPPVPIMGPPAVKFVDPDVGDGHSIQVYFDWSDSYATAPGEAIATWDSEGERDHSGNIWTSAAETPGWQTFDFISGLRGFKVTLEVDDGNGNATTLPYRRGIRYVFTLRRPGQTQEYDPANAEPITEFRLNGPVQGSWDSGYWKTSITVYGEAASHYEIQPEALVVLFTDDWYMSEAPYLSPAGMRNVSIGPIYDRENILLVGRVDGSSIDVDSETGTVTFDVLSPGAEADMYHDYPIPIQDNSSATDWINTPSLTPDRALWLYICWHTTLAQITDFYLPGDTHPIWAVDFLEGTIYDVADSFLESRILGRMLCDKYGRIHCEVAAQYQPYGDVETLWVLDDGDWHDILDIRQNMRAQAKSADAGGLIYTSATGTVIPKLSRAPGQFDKYRGTSKASQSLAINSQWELNILAGIYLEGLNYQYEIGIRLAGFWPYLDIAPQRAIYVHKEIDRGTIGGRFLPKTVTYIHDPSAGCMSTEVQTEQEMNDGVPGVTIPIPEELPDLEKPETGLPETPVFPAGFGEVWMDIPFPAAGYWYAVDPGAATHYWDEAHAPTYAPAAGSWTNVAADTSIYKTCLMWSTSTNRFFGYGWDGIWEYSPLPLGSGAWSQKWTEAEIADLLGHAADYDQIYLFRMEFSTKSTQEGWGWVGGKLDYTDGDGDDHVVLFCLHTRNGWDNIVYSTEIFDEEENVDFDSYGSYSEEGGLAVDMHANYVYVMLAKAVEDDGVGNPTYDGWWRLYRSYDFGSTFSLAQSENHVYGMDGYALPNPDEMFCDVWVPWVSSAYAGGTVFWTTTVLQQTNLGIEYIIVPKVYRSQNHALTREDIGDDGGDLTSGLNRLGGPYNSAERVYGSLSMRSGRDADQIKAYRWRDGYGWTLVRASSQAGNFWDALCWVVMAQDGYDLDRYMAYGQPYYVNADVGTDTDVGPGLAPISDINIYWITWLPS